MVEEFVMKKSMIRVIAGLALTVAASGAALAQSSFSETFESGSLAAWTGRAGGASSAAIVLDPFNSSNHVLTFNRRTTAGDLFSRAVFSPVSGASGFVLNFDYLGACGKKDCGGYLGTDLGLPGPKGSEQWLAGTQANFPGLSAVLQDTGHWEHVSITFASVANIHLKLEQFNQAAGGAAGRVYFDNIQLTSVSAVPEPSSGLMLLAGLASLLWLGCRRKANA
jgi:hypothetical protein